MQIEDYFSASYQGARGRFLTLCRNSELAITSHHNPHARAPDGGDLAMDVATLGPDNAERLIVMCSGTHGVEGYCGSGIQSALLGEGHLSDLPRNTRVALVHAVNPYGFAHNRRVNEDNIDLNRNFLDFGSEQPRNIGYDDIHNFLVPEHWEGEARAEADAALASYAKANGPAAFQQAASGGQYSHSDGVFYGGTKPSWSAQTVVSVVKELAATASEVSVLDFHTGLGPYGHGEMIAVGTHAQVERTFELYRGFDVTDPEAGTSSSAPVQGTIAHGIERALPGKETTFVALEYGTLPMRDVMTAVRADNWLYQHGAVDSELGKLIKRQIRDAFYCDEAEWKNMVFARAVEVVSATFQ